MVKYRLATEEDYRNINDFHNRIYKSNRTIEQFYWEFHNCPFGKSIYVIAEDEGKVVGTNCVIPIDLITSDQQIIHSGKSEDTLVDPEYRGQKIFYHIYEFLFERCKEEGIKIIWGFTSAKKPFRNLGFSVPFDHQQSLAVNNIWKSYQFLSALNSKNGIKDKLKILGLTIYSKLKLSGRLRAGLRGYRITEDEDIIDGISNLIQSNLTLLNSSYAILQNSRFQQWRIYQNPNYHKVHTYGFYDTENNLSALIVLNSHKNKVAYICQASFRQELSAPERIKILKFVTGKMFKQGIHLIRNWHFDTNTLNSLETKLFKDAHYTHLKIGIGFVWKELDNIDIEPEGFYLSRVSTQGV
jgi:N-acetylglutamate synthase-like GNAT family acetyltransferase